MAQQQIKFDLRKCEDAITKLTAAKQSLHEIVNTNLSRLMANVEAIYDSPTNKKMQEAYGSIQTDYNQHFETALNDAITYLEKDVKAKLIELETAASNAIQD